MSRKKHIDKAAKAHCDLTLFDAVIKLLESGSLSAAAHGDAKYIIRRAHAAQQKCLLRIDAATAAAEAD